MVSKDTQTEITNENFDLRGATVAGQLKQIFNELNVLGEDEDFLQFQENADMPTADVPEYVKTDVPPENSGQEISISTSEESREFLESEHSGEERSEDEEQYARIKHRYQEKLDEKLQRQAKRFSRKEADLKDLLIMFKKKIIQ